MKKCTYCGKEYADTNFELCEIDGHKLADYTPRPPPLPKPCLARLDLLWHFFLLVFVFGAGGFPIGLPFGAVTAIINRHLLLEVKSPIIRYGVTALVAAGAVLGALVTRGFIEVISRKKQ